MSVRGILFDLDGTLIDSNDLHIEAWQLAFADLGYVVPTAAIRPLIGTVGTKLISAAVGVSAERQHGHKLRTNQARLYATLARDRGIRLFPGAVELVRAVRWLGLKTALMTCGGQGQLQVTTDACGHDFGADVDEVMTSDEATMSNPEPDPTQVAANRLRLEPQECVLIGDTRSDGAMASAAGVCFWGVMSGGCEAAELWAAGADRVFPDVAAVWWHLDDLMSPIIKSQPTMRAVG